MAALEEEGFITQPHTSAGRIPTDKGYRLFVDRLTTLKPMSAAEKRAIASFLDGAVDLDDVVHRSVRLLSQLTRQVAVVQYPTLSRSTVRHVELVALTPTRLLVVLILSTGRVEQRLVELDQDASDDDVSDVRSTVHRAAIGETIAAALTALRGLEQTDATTDAVVAMLVDAMSDHRSDERVVVSGTANLARYGDSFEVDVRPLLEALEEHVVLLKLLGEAHSGGGVLVRIGHEGPYEELRVDQRGLDRLRAGRRGIGQPGHRGSDPHGLPGHDGRRARRRPLRLAHPRRGMRFRGSSPRSSHLNHRKRQRTVGEHRPL